MIGASIEKGSLVKNMRYLYCPECGKKLTARAAGDDGEVSYCDACETYWFDSFKSCAIVMIYNEKNEIVLCKQNYLSDVYMTFTSGYMQPGETAEETAIREVKEELGIDAENLTYTGTYWFGKNDMLMHGFIAYSPKCDFVLSSEVDEAKWVSSQKVPEMIFPEVPGNAMWELYRYYLKNIEKKDIRNER